MLTQHNNVYSFKWKADMKKKIQFLLIFIEILQAER